MAPSSTPHGAETHPHELSDPFLDDPQDEHRILHTWRQATPFLADMAPLVVLGLAALLLGAFVHQLWLTSSPASDGLARTAGWLSWLGRTAIGAALVVASMRPSPAVPALRVALLGLGAVVLMGLGGLATP